VSKQVFCIGFIPRFEPAVGRTARAANKVSYDSRTKNISQPRKKAF